MPPSCAVSPHSRRRPGPNFLTRPRVDIRSRRTACLSLTLPVKSTALANAWSTAEQDIRRTIGGQLIRRIIEIDVSEGEVRRLLGDFACRRPTVAGPVTWSAMNRDLVELPRDADQLTIFPVGVAEV